MPEWMKGFVPDGLQSVKQLLNYGANFFFALLMIQVLGLDLTKYGIAPVVDWRAAGALFCAFSAVQYKIGGIQDEKLMKKLDTKPPAQLEGKKDPTQESGGEDQPT